MDFVSIQLVQMLALLEAEKGCNGAAVGGVDGRVRDETD
jgi:hypothetical protein